MCGLGEILIDPLAKLVIGGDGVLRAVMALFSGGAEPMGGGMGVLRNAAPGIAHQPDLILRRRVARLGRRQELRIGCLEIARIERRHAAFQIRPRRLKRKQHQGEENAGAEPAAKEKFAVHDPHI